MKSFQLTPPEATKITTRLKLYPLLPLQNTTITETDDNRYTCSDYVGMRSSSGEDCFKQNNLSANLLIRIIRCPHLSESIIRARLTSLKTYFQSKTLDAGTYHWDLSQIFTTSNTTITTVVLVRNYSMDIMERNNVTTASGHLEILEALTYDIVTSDAEENFDALTTSNSFDNDKHQRQLKRIFGTSNEVEFVSTATTQLNSDNNQENVPCTTMNRRPTNSTLHHKKTNKRLKWELDEDNTCIGSGAFGQVFLGWLVIDNPDGTTKRERVAVKALTTGRSNAQIKNRDDAISLNKEIQTMIRCVQKNVF